MSKSFFLSLLPVAANIVSGAARALANGAAVSAGNGAPAPAATVAVVCDGSLEREALAAAVGVFVGALPMLWRGLRRLAAVVLRRHHSPEEEEEEKEEEEEQEQEKQEQEADGEEEGRKRKRIKLDV